MRRSLPFLIAAVIGIAPALAQKIDSADRDYLVQDAQGAAYELNLAKLATAKASRADVKAYAGKLVADHETYNAALQKLGTQEGLSLPNDMTTTDSAKLDVLKALSGSLFDKAFIEQAMSINAEDVKEADKERNTTKDAAIKTFIGTFASMDREHEALAKKLNDAK